MATEYIHIDDFKLGERPGAYYLTCSKNKTMEIVDKIRGSYEMALINNLKDDTIHMLNKVFLERGFNEPRVVLVLDHCSIGEYLTDNIIRQLLYVGRHMNIDLIIAEDYSAKLPHDLRIRYILL